MSLTDLQQQLAQYGPAREHSKPALPTHWRGRARSCPFKWDKNIAQAPHNSSYSLQLDPQRLPVSSNSRFFQKTILARAISELRPTPCPGLSGCPSFVICMAECDIFEKNQGTSWSESIFNPSQRLNPACKRLRLRPLSSPKK